jgi:Mu-like prophage major head subunit gpT
MNAAQKITLADHYDPLALSLINRYSPQAMTSVFGAQAARAHPPMSIKDVAGVVQSRRPDLRGNFSATLTSTDFSHIINDVANAAGLMGYVMNPPEILRISHETNDIDNFLPVERVRPDGFPTLLAVDEGAEITYGTVGERGESYQAFRYSRILEFTEQALINDRLHLLVHPALQIGEAVADMKASVLAHRIASNPVLSDGKPVFHADHGNIGFGDPDMMHDTLVKATTAMRRQKHIDGERPLDVVPAFILVPPELEVTARKVVATVTPNSITEVNPFAKKLEVLVEPRLTDPDTWYLFARPERQLGLEHGTVNGTDDPEVRTEARMERHVVMTRVTADFAAGWIDYRGAFKIQPASSEENPDA